MEEYLMKMIMEKIDTASFWVGAFRAAGCVCV